MGFASPTLSQLKWNEAAESTAPSNFSTQLGSARKVGVGEETFAPEFVTLVTFPDENL